MLLRLGFIVFFVQFCTTVHGLCERTECQCVPYRHNSRLAECVFRSREMMAMKASDFPSDLGAVVMSGGRELRFDVEVFSHLAHLESVTVRGNLKVFVKEHSFANMSSRVPVSFEFSDANFLTIEGMSWKNPSGPISVLVARVNTAIIHGQAFSRLTNFTAQDVGKLEILEKAFFIARPYNESITTINLERVHIENLAKTTFLSSVHEVRFSGSEVKKVQPDAFSALQIERVLIENTTLHRIEAGAFSDHTLIQTLTLRQARLHNIESAAFLSGLSNLVISHSKLEVVRPGAMNITVATVLMADNIFSHVHTRGVVLKEWNTLVISNNTFKRIDREAFTSPTIPTSVHKPGGPGEDYLIVTEEPVKAHEFNFTRNIIIDVPHHYEAAFDFSVSDDSKVLVDSNFFLFSCHCNMTRVQTLMSGGKTAMFDTGMCSVDDNLARCFKLPQGFVNMMNFTETICKLHDSLLCEQVQRDADDSQNEPSITSAIDISFEDVEREKQILTSLFAIILVGMLLVMVVSAMLWVGRKGYCAKARRFLLPSTNSLVDHLARMFSSSGVTPAVSVSRLSVHEYAELQRKMEEAKMNEEDDLPLEDKATQTLPEELTQELLQSLKEKLNDPENYSEARDMIEHLYDLIKVEENCNKNYVDSTFIHIEEGPDNVYDVIKPKKMTARSGRPELVSQGTRAPSPDKLLPYSKRPTIVSEYQEPRDRKVHTYSEIPPRPDLLPGPITTSISMANRPLPAEPTQL